MQQGNETGKIIGAFAMVTTFIVLGIFSVLAYTKKPTDSEITEYIEEHRKPDVQGNTTVELSMTEAVTSWENTTEAILPTQLGNELLPAGATLKADATLPTIAGKYEGEMRFTELSGYETVDGAPENIGEIVAQEMASNHPYSMELMPDGHWEFKIDSQMGMNMSDRELSDPKDAENGLSGIELIKSVDNGAFRVEREMSEKEGMGSVAFYGTAFEDAQGTMINGGMDVVMFMGTQGITVRIIYNARYVGPND